MKDFLHSSLFLVCFRRFFRNYANSVVRKFHGTIFFTDSVVDPWFLHLFFNYLVSMDIINNFKADFDWKFFDDIK